jgi:hypothetical protein
MLGLLLLFVWPFFAPLHRRRRREAAVRGKACVSVRKDTFLILLNAVVFAAAGLAGIYLLIRFREIERVWQPREYRWDPYWSSDIIAFLWRETLLAVVLFLGGLWLTWRTLGRAKAFLYAGCLPLPRARQRLCMLMGTHFLVTLAGVAALAASQCDKLFWEKLIRRVPDALAAVPEAFDAGPPVERFREACAQLAGEFHLTPEEVERGLEIRVRQWNAILEIPSWSEASFVLAYLSEEPRSAATLQQRELANPTDCSGEYRAILAQRRAAQAESDPPVLATRLRLARAFRSERNNAAFEKVIDELLVTFRTVPVPDDGPVLSLLTDCTRGIDDARKEALLRLLIAVEDRKAASLPDGAEVRRLNRGRFLSVDDMRRELADSLHIQKKYTGEEAERRALLAILEDRKARGVRDRHLDGRIARVRLSLARCMEAQSKDDEAATLAAAILSEALKRRDHETIGEATRLQTDLAKKKAAALKP